MLLIHAPGGEVEDAAGLTAVLHVLPDLPLVVAELPCGVIVFWGCWFGYVCVLCIVYRFRLGFTLRTLVEREEAGLPPENAPDAAPPLEERAHQLVLLGVRRRGDLRHHLCANSCWGLVVVVIGLSVCRCH